MILSLDEVSDLAQKGEELTWEDFEAYSFEDIGSGLHIRKYEIDDDYHVLVGGRSIDIDPMYIYLVKTNGEKTSSSDNITWLFLLSQANNNTVKERINKTIRLRFPFNPIAPNSTFWY